MAGLLPKSLWDESEQSIADAVVKPLTNSLTQALGAYQQTAQQAASSFKLPHPSEIFGGGAAPTTDQAQQPAAPSFSLPHPSDIFGGTDAAAAPQEAGGPRVAGSSAPSTPAVAASGVPQAMPTGQPSPGGVPMQDAGEIDNSSRESFARTAYPQALRAANGDPELAKRLLAMAISENGTVGSGGKIGVGYNFGGIKCFDATTEVLTEGGWKLWPTVNESDVFATWNAVREDIEYQRALSLTRSRYVGLMYRIKMDSVDLFVTPDHRMWVRPEPGAPFQIMTARDVSGRPVEYMTPRLAMSDGPDVTVGDAIAAPDLGLGDTIGKQAANRANVGLGQFRVAPHRSSDLSFFVAHVGHIARLRALKQVIGAHTRRIVAVVADLLVGRQRYGVLDFVRRSMGKDLLPSVARAESSVTIAVAAGSPNPARTNLRSNDGAALVNLCPESLFDGAEMLAPAGTATVASVALLDDNRVGEEADSASLTDSRDGTLLGHHDLLSRSRGVCPGRVSDGSGHHTNYTPLEGWFAFDGMVYCATVPNGLLIVRRNGKVVISGNSDPQAIGSGNYGTWESEGGQRVNQNADFAAYPSVQAGFEAIPRFIQTNMPQAWARYQQTHDAAGLIRDINAAGYATNPTWFSDIESIVGGNVAPSLTAGPSPADSPSSPPAAPPNAAGGSNYKTSDNLPDDSGMSAGDQKRAKRAAMSGQPQPMPDGSAPYDWQPPESPPIPISGQRTDGYYDSSTGEQGDTSTGVRMPAYNVRIAPDGTPLGGNGSAADQYRQSLGAPTMGPDTATGADDEYDPRAVDEGPHELAPAPIPANSDANSAPIPAQYAASGDDPGTAVRSSYNDPTDGGTQQTPLPQQTAPFTPPSSGLQPVYDAAGNFLHWIQGGAEALGNAITSAAADDTNPSPAERAQRVSVAGLGADDQMFNAARTVAGTAPPVQSPGYGEQDYVPRTANPVEQNTGMAASERMRQIEANAAAAQGITDPVRSMAAPLDPTWRAQNPEMAQEYDDLQHELGMVVGGTFGTMGEGNHRAPQSGRPTVEVIQEQLQQANDIVQRLLHGGDSGRLAQAQDARAALESQLVDAQNARRALEPRIRSDVGAKESSLPPSEQTVENRMDAIMPPPEGRMRPEDLSGPVSIPVDNPQMRLGSGVVPQGEGGSLLPARRAVSGDVIPPQSRSTVQQLTDEFDALQRVIEDTPMSDPGRRALIARQNEVAARLDEASSAAMRGESSGADSIVGSGTVPRPGSSIAPTVANAAQGGFLGQQAANMEDDRRQQQGLPPMTAAERAAFIGGSAVLAVEAGRRMRGGEGRRLGSGVVPEGEPLPGNDPRLLRASNPKLAGAVEPPAVHPAQGVLPGMEDPMRASIRPADWSASPVDAAVQAAQEQARIHAKAVQDGTADLPPLPPAAASWWQRKTMENARRMAENGVEPLSPLRWLNRLAQTTVYSSLIGPPSAVANFGANLAMPILSTPRELVRPVVRAVQTRNTAALREYPTAAWALTTDLMDVGKSVVDALAARGRFAQNPNHPMLSGQTINPAGQKLAEGLELGNRVFSALPDSIFGTLATNFGERRAAAQMATDLGLHGGDWGAVAQGLIQDVRTARSGGAFSGPTTGELIAAIKQADEMGLEGAARQRQIASWLQQAADLRGGELVPNPDIAQGIVKQGQEILDGIGAAGKAYGDHQTFRDELGVIGKAARTASGADLPVVGPAITPFFNTNWNVWKRLGENSPVGPALNRSRPTYDKAFDAAFGTLVLAGIANYATGGVVTGSGPSDPQARKDLESQGWQRYSTLKDGVYVPNRLLYGMFEGPVNMAGDWHDHVAYQKPGEAWTQKSFEDMAQRVGQQIRNAPTLTGWANVLDAMSGQGLAGKLERYGSSQVTAHIPYASTARAIGTSQDTAERTVERGKDVPPDVTVGQQIAAGVGNRSGLPVNQDSLGRPKENQQQGIWAFVPKMSSQRPDPTIQAFTDAGVDIGGPSKTLNISVPGASGRTTSYQLPMNPEEQRAWQRLRGEAIQKIVTPELLASDKWKNAKPADREMFLRMQLADANEYAKQKMQEQIGLAELRRRLGAAQGQKAS